MAIHRERKRMNRISLILTDSHIAEWLIMYTSIKNVISLDRYWFISWSSIFRPGKILSCISYKMVLCYCQGCGFKQVSPTGQDLRIRTFFVHSSVSSGKYNSGKTNVVWTWNRCMELKELNITRNTNQTTATGYNTDSWSVDLWTSSTNHLYRPPLKKRKIK